MSVKLFKLSMNQLGLVIDEMGNLVPYFHPLETYIVEPFKKIVCIDEAYWNSLHACTYKKIYNSIPQKELDEIRTGFYSDELEAYEQRIPIEIFK